MSQGSVDDVSPVAAQDWAHDVSRADTSMLDPAPVSTAQVLGGMSDAEGRPVDLKRVTDRVLDWYGYSPGLAKSCNRCWCPRCRKSNRTPISTRC